MDWVGIIIVLALVLFAAGMVWKVVNSPTFWIQIAVDLSKLIGPVVWGIITKPEDPETRRRRQEVERRGGTWDHYHKREKR